VRRVVLLGGGYVTLHAYQELSRRLAAAVRSGELEVVVVSADDCHSFHGFTGEVVAGVLPLERTRTPLVEACPLATVVHGRATHVDLTTRTVTVEPVGGAAGEDRPAQRVTFDELVLGTGSREPVSCVPGLPEHGHTLRGVGDIGALTEHLHALADGVDRPDGAAPAARACVIVAGGGIAGTELAAAVADLGCGRLDVLLVHPGDRLLPELRTTHPRLADRAEHELDRLGVRTLLRTRLREVTAHGAVLAREDEPTRTTHVEGTVVATIGQVPVSLPGMEDLPRDARGRLVTAPDLSVTHGVWAAGDAARVLHPETGEPVAANALWAIKAGAHAGRNVARRLQGRPARPFAYRGLGQAASYGLGRSVADLYGVELTGGVAWALRMAFFLRFMPSRRRAAAVVLDLARLLLTGAPGARHPTDRPDAIPVPAATRR
jgi:NADH:ubiquinone reductase (H+-translocating)